VSLRRNYPLWLRGSCSAGPGSGSNHPLAAQQEREASEARIRAEGSCRAMGKVDRQAELEQKQAIWSPRLFELERLQKEAEHSRRCCGVCWRKNRTPWPGQ